MTQHLEVPSAELFQVKRHSRHTGQFVMPTPSWFDAVEGQVRGDATTSAAFAENLENVCAFVLRPPNLAFAHAAKKRRD